MLRYRRYLIAAAQATVSVGAFVWIASGLNLTNFITSIRGIPPTTAILASLLVGLGFVVSSLRWRLLLGNLSISLPAWQLVRYYFIGLFFSAFLPTSIGGDAFRVYVVGRPDKFAPALFATLQDRLLGLCGAMAPGLLVMPAVGFVFPPEVSPWVVGMQILSIIALIFVLYPPFCFMFFALMARPLSRLSRLTPASWSSNGRIAKISDELMRLMRTRPSNIPLILILAILPITVMAFAYQVLLWSMDVGTECGVLLIIIPIVWIARLLPISLGGIGVGEGTFAVLANFAGIDREKAFATALVILGIQLGWALFGGLLLLRSGLKRALT